jgi:hypothetical protein
MSDVNAKDSKKGRNPSDNGPGDEDRTEKDLGDEEPGVEEPREEEQSEEEESEEEEEDIEERMDAEATKKGLGPWREGIINNSHLCDSCTFYTLYRRLLPQEEWPRPTPCVWVPHSDQIVGEVSSMRFEDDRRSRHYAYRRFVFLEYGQTGGKRIRLPKCAEMVIKELWPGDRIFTGFKPKPVGM